MSIAAWKDLQQMGPNICGLYEAAKNMQDTDVVRSLYTVDCKRQVMPPPPPAATIFECKSTEDIASETSACADFGRLEKVSGELRHRI